MRHLISLGVRCDVAFQLRAHSGTNASHFFDWLATPLEAVVLAFNHDFEIFKPDHLELTYEGSHRFVRDRVTKISFHHQFPIIGSNVTQDFLLFYPAFLSKFRHLAARFREYATERKVTLVRRDVTLPGAMSLEAAYFDRFPKSNAEFLYITHREEQFETPHGRSIKMDRPGTGLGGFGIWARMLTEQNLVKRPYRLSTEDVLGSDHDNHALAGTERFTDEELLTALSFNEESMSMKLELSRFYQRQRQWHDASHVLETISNPVSVEILVEKAYVDWKAGIKTVSEAISSIGDAGASAALTIRSTHFYVDLLTADRQFVLAIAICDSALEVHSVAHGIYYRKATCYFRSGNLERARLAISTALSLTSSSAAYHQLEAGILIGLGLLPAAIDAQYKAVHLGGGVNGSRALGNLLVRANRREEAVAVYLNLIAKRPDLAEEFNHRLEQLKVLPSESGAAVLLDEQELAGHFEALPMNQ